MRSESVFSKINDESVTTFVSEDGFASITCPHCGLTKRISVDAYRGKKNSIKVRCRCKSTFTRDLEFRQYHRKPTELSAVYYDLSEVGGGRATIRDLSKNGIGFMVSGIHNVRVGHTVLMNFTLDNQKQTELNKKGVVRSVNKNRIGCEFRKDQAFEKDLGFYLRA